MKYLFSLILLSPLFFGLKAQGNLLKFSRVLIINQTANQTVPQDKVWKVESFIVRQREQDMGIDWASACTATWGQSQTYQTVFYVNNIPTKHLKIDVSTASSGNTERFIYPNSPFPFWLPAGNTLRVACPEAQLSVIEFNVVPE